MSIIARYDADADALYVTLRHGVRSRAVEIDEATYVDIDAAGQALGLEFLYPAMGMSLDAAVSRFQLHSRRHAIAAAIAVAGAPGEIPTMTGGASGGLVSSTIMTVAIEGTVPAALGVPVQAITHPDHVIYA